MREKNTVMIDDGIVGLSLKRVSKILLARPKFFIAPTSIKLMMVSRLMWEALEANVIA